LFILDKVFSRSADNRKAARGFTLDVIRCASVFDETASNPGALRPVRLDFLHFSFSLLHFLSVVDGFSFMPNGSATVALITSQNNFCPWEGKSADRRLENVAKGSDDEFGEIRYAKLPKMAFVLRPAK
jgi:hypothetical protein